MSYNNIFSSIINNKNNINKHRDDISSLNIKVDNIAQGLIIKDEFKLIKYTGYTDWRLKIQIYSNIHDVDSQVIRPDLLINNNYELIYTDYIHLLNNNELTDSNFCFIDTYNKYTSNLEKLSEFNITPRLFQDTNFQNIIYDNFDSRLLIHVNLNILLNIDVPNIHFNQYSNITLPPYNFFINKIENGNNINDSSILPEYNNLNKGWNKIDWFFIHDFQQFKNNSNLAFYLGFNPLLSLYNETQLVTGLINDNTDNIYHNSIQYNINSLNDIDNTNTYILEQDTSLTNINLITKHVMFSSNFNTSNFNFNINFNKFLENNNNLNSLSFYIDNIIISNLNNSELEINNLKINNNLHTKYNQIISQNKFHIFTDNEFYPSSNLILLDQYSLNDNSNLEFNLNFQFDTPNLSLFDIYINSFIQYKDTTYNSNLTLQHNIPKDIDFTNKIIFQKDGSVGIGTNDTGNYSLYVNNISSTKKGIYCADDITILSNQNYKTNIKTIENPIEKLLQLRGVSYTRTDRDTDETRYGFIAQEVQKILPEACDGDNGIKVVDIVALLVEAFKELYNKT